MGLLEDRLEPFVGDVGVTLGGCHGGVSQQFLDAAQVRSPGQQVSGHGVPQRVRTDGCTTRRRGGAYSHSLRQPVWCLHRVEKH